MFTPMFLFKRIRLGRRGGLVPSFWQMGESIPIQEADSVSQKAGKWQKGSASRPG